MNGAEETRRGRRWLTGFPKALLVVAALIVAAYGVGHMLGLRGEVSLLFATSQAEGGAGAAGGRILAAGLYVLAHVGTTLLAPILVVGGVLYAGMMLVLRRRGNRVVDGSDRMS